MKQIKDILSKNEIVSDYKSAVSRKSNKYWISRKITADDGSVLDWINPNFDQVKEGDIAWLQLPRKVSEIGDLYENEYEEHKELVAEVQQMLLPMGLHMYSKDLKDNKLPRLSASGTSVSWVVLPNQEREE